MITLLFLEVSAFLFMLMLLAAYQFLVVYPDRFKSSGGKRWVEVTIKVLFGLVFVAAIVLYLVSLGRV